MHPMKRMVFAGLLLVSAGAALSRVLIPPAQAQAQATRRWEHFCFTVGWTGNSRDKELNEKLTGAGREGWELVSVANSQGALYCMKRPAP